LFSPSLVCHFEIQFRVHFQFLLIEISLLLLSLLHFFLKSRRYK